VVVKKQVNAEVESVCDKMRILLSVMESSGNMEEIMDSTHLMGLVSVLNNNLLQIYENVNKN